MLSPVTGVVQIMCDSSTSMLMLMPLSRLCFFTSDSTMRKERFMQQINFSHKGGLTCLFNDYHLAEFIQNSKSKSGNLSIKSAVEHVGPQSDGSWVLGPSLFIDKEGVLQNPATSKYSWIGNMYEGPGIAHINTACRIQLPLSASPLAELYAWVKENLLHNFIPSMLFSGSCCMALHYKKIIETLLFCPVLIAYGESSGTGKTTSLIIGLSPTGSYPSCFVSQATYQKYADLCSSSYLPLGIDDPKSKNAISDLVIALFNGAKAAMMKHEEKLIGQCRMSLLHGYRFYLNIHSN